MSKRAICSWKEQIAPVAILSWATGVNGSWSLLFKEQQERIAYNDFERKSEERIPNPGGGDNGEDAGGGGDNGEDAGGGGGDIGEEACGCGDPGEDAGDCSDTGEDAGRGGDIYEILSVLMIKHWS